MNFKFVPYTKDNNFYNISNEWLNYKKSSIKESTFARYTFLLQHYLLPEYRSIKIRRLKKVNFNELLSKYNYLSASTLKQIRYVLIEILEYTNLKHNTKINTKIIPSVKETNFKTIEIFTNEEIDMLKNYCVNDSTNKSLSVLISLLTGLRIGEISALKWENIDFTRNYISVKSTLERVKVDGHTKLLITMPKSKNSIREIPINDFIANHLLSIYKANKPSLNSFVLTNTESCYEPRTITNHYKKVLKDLNISNHNFHNLRHTFATKCLEINMDPKEVSLILGHSSVTITLNRYVHPNLDKVIINLNKL